MAAGRGLSSDKVRRQVCSGPRMGKDRGCPSGIILAGTRLWVFGESVSADGGTRPPGCHTALRLATTSVLRAATTWDERALLLYRVS